MHISEAVGWKGSISKEEYCRYRRWMGAIVVGWFALPFLLGGLLPDDHPLYAIMGLTLGIAAIALLYAYTMIMAKACRSQGMSPWLSVIAFVTMPLVWIGPLVLDCVLYYRKEK